MPIAEASVAMLDFTFSDHYSRELKHDSDVLVSKVSADEQVSAQWDSIIDDRLIDWAQHPKEFELEGLIAPSNAAVCKAQKLLNFMRDRGWPLPTGVIADGEGGIVIENRRDPVYQRIEISDQGSMQLVTFRNRKMQGSPAPIDID